MTLPLGPRASADLAAGALVVIPLPNGVCAAIWVIGREDDMVSFLVLDGHWEASPPPDALLAAKLSPASSPPLPGVPNVWKGASKRRRGSSWSRASRSSRRSSGWRTKTRG
jgi:hypothetical protein